MPDIPVGDVVRRFRLPRWLRWIMDRVKGLRIPVGGNVIVLSDRGGPTQPRTGLDQPHRSQPPKVREP